MDRVWDAARTLADVEARRSEVSARVSATRGDAVGANAAGRDHLQLVGRRMGREREREGEQDREGERGRG